MNSHVIEKVKEKSRKYKKYRSTHDGVDYLAYMHVYATKLAGSAERQRNSLRGR